ncbi:Osmotin thaumatin-like protein [Dendrothele bispora CBS 962.96]|uniref:Osmotin thaumatin-like protein n=1 Tax=Dendrothele bispora (strain CBS 962.96) TaxID=1314807 RepID=A0A4S8KRI8_DENBC|nr:Osmotin thaumatin-like protein [Dendrothele bispora CBS 962.96]
MSKLIVVGALLTSISAATARTFTVKNACPFTIWYVIFTDLNVGSAVPNFATGWEAAAFTQVSFSVPDNWRSGRMWARRDCNFSSNPGPNSCLDGGCNGGLVCDPHTGTGVPPASLAEWTLSTNPNIPDNYDVSLVDGYNLPLRITNNVGCPVADCPVDLGPNCPANQKGPFDSVGFPVGCKSACLVDPNPSNSRNCCSGQFNTPATCPSSGVANYHYFKDNCPNAYAYAFDDATALKTCPSNLRADYTLTFCP